MVSHPHRFRAAWCVAVAGAALIGAASAVDWHNEPPEKQPDHAQAAGTPDLTIADATSQLKQTHVTAYLRREHAPGTNLLWCATFQIAWDQFPQLLNAPLTLRGDPPMALALNASPWKPGDLDTGSFVAQVGIGPKTVDSIKEALERKFKGKAVPSVLPSPGDIGP